MATLDNIAIRNELRPGDLGYLLYLHGSIYSRENGYGLQFEQYVMEGLVEFAKRYDPSVDRVWMCEHDGRIIGCMVLMHRDGGTAQLRYFLIDPEYRGIGLGGKLMASFVQFLRLCDYRSAYLWTTDEQVAAISLYERYGFTLAEENASIRLGKPVREQRFELRIRETP